MLIFVYEYTCAVSDANLAPSLCAEGRAMLSAVVEDFERLRGVTTCTLLSAGHGPADIPSAHPHGHDGAEEPAFRRLASAADWTLVIAPETDDLLLTRCHWVLEAAGRLLGPSPEAVRLTADKLELSHHLARHDVPTPPTVALPPAGDPAAAGPFPAVCKPRHGAGSQATFCAAGCDDLAPCAERARQEMGPAELVLQPFVPGLPVSVAFLAGPGGATALLPAEQHLSGDGRFRYLGGRLPLAPGLAARARRLAGRAVAAVQGLRGYVGVDLVLGDADGGGEDRVIEINPRLTTSYIGLRRLARVNLAGAMLRAAGGLAVGELGWHAGAVRFRADGAVEEGA
jgi:predicted ATP-grasp superfamily ATP-dependent carboligase